MNHKLNKVWFLSKEIAIAIGLLEMKHLLLEGSLVALWCLRECLRIISDCILRRRISFWLFLLIILPSKSRPAFFFLMKTKNCWNTQRRNSFLFYFDKKKKKKTGNWRMCIHGREIKTHTPKNHCNNTQPKFAFDNLLSPERRKNSERHSHFSILTKEQKTVDGWMGPLWKCI